MNSRDQDFVKSFSRRIRLGETGNTPVSTTTRTSTTTSASLESNAPTPRNDSVARQIAQENAVSGSGGKSVVAERRSTRSGHKPPIKPLSPEKSATWWIDESKEMHYRVDHVVATEKPDASDIRLANFRDELVDESRSIEPNPISEPIDSQYLVGLADQQTLESFCTQHDTTHRIDKPHIKFFVQPLQRRAKNRTTEQVTTEQVTTEQVTTEQPAPEQPEIPSEEQLLTESAAMIQEVASQVTAASSPQHPVAEPQNKPQNKPFNEAVSEATVFKPAWEVDQFALPTNVGKLFFEGEVFQQIAEQMLEAVETGLASVLVTSVHGEEGRSTVAMGIAMAAAAAGIRVALVDGDLVYPTLVDDLSLDIESDWLVSIRNKTPLSSIAVHAVEDGVTFLPLLPTERGEEATEAEVKELIDTLKQNFDLVIVDGTVGDSPATQWCADAVDSVMIVQDVGHTKPEEVKRLSDHLTGRGVKGIGVVENFSENA